MTDRTIDWPAFYRPLHRFVSKRVPSPADAEDIVQRILERAFSSASKVERAPIDHVAHWLFGIARNAVADHHRAHARALVQNADDMEATPASNETDTARAEVVACIEPLLRALSGDESRLLRWADMESRGMKSIAAELGISLTAAKSRVQRARKQLIRVTQQCCAITLDARGRVTQLTPRSAQRAIACSGHCSA